MGLEAGGVSVSSLGRRGGSWGRSWSGGALVLIPRRRRRFPSSRLPPRRFVSPPPSFRAPRRFVSPVISSSPQSTLRASGSQARGGGRSVVVVVVVSSLK
jgi:hypothetical protein